jgi:hypothetical protein
MALDVLLVLCKLFRVGIFVCDLLLELLGRWMGMSAMVRAVLYGKVLVSACFDDLSAVPQLGFENGILWV